MPKSLSELLDGHRLLLVGGGKMGLALMQGWLSAGVTTSQIMVQEPSPTDALMASGVTLNPNPAALENQPPTIIVLAVKPQMIEAVLPALASQLTASPLVLSLMAGVPVSTMHAIMGAHAAYVRTMPNTPASIGRGMTALYADEGVSEAQKAISAALLAAVGETVWLNNEKMIDAVTAISGSGPAYVFHLVEALQASAQSLGLDADMAGQLATQTIIGSAAMLDEEGAEAAQLRRNVTSPGGTTEAALDVLMGENGLSDLMRRATQSAANRAQELAQIGKSDAEE